MEAAADGHPVCHEGGAEVSEHVASTEPCVKRPADLPASLDAKTAGASHEDALRDSRGFLDSPLLVPTALLLAAYTVYIFPERGVAVLLLLGALATFGPTAQPLYRLLTEMSENVALRASTSPRLRALARHQMRAALRDPITQRCFTDACRDSLIEAMQAESTQDMMVSSCTQAVTTATIAASQNQDLQSTLNTAMRNGVKEALSDDTVVGTFFNVVKEGLRDPMMHQAALKGAVRAANPLKDLTVTNPLKDLAVPSLAHGNPLKAVSDKVHGVSSTLKEAIVDAEAKSLANASGLSRAPPPTIQGAKSPPHGSPPQGPVDPELAKVTVSDAFGSDTPSDAFRPKSLISKSSPSGSPLLGPVDHSDTSGSGQRKSTSPDPLESFIAHGRTQ